LLTGGLNERRERERVEADRRLEENKNNAQEKNETKVILLSLI